MLDIEEAEAPVHTGLNIVSLAEMRTHLNMQPTVTALDAVITAAIKEAADKLHGINGELNRTIFPMTWRRYLKRFPESRIIQLPYPPLVAVTSITYETGDSPSPTLDPALYTVRYGGLVGEIELEPGNYWPKTDRVNRAVTVTFTAGYSTYPEKLKRMVKTLAAHYINYEAATVDDLRQSYNRKVEFGHEASLAALRVSASYDDWE